MNSRGVPDRFYKGKKSSTKSGWLQVSPAQRQHPGWVSPVIAIGANQWGKVREDLSRRQWKPPVDSAFRPAYSPRQMTCMRSGNICSGKKCRRGVIKALFGWAVIILPRSQDLGCQLTWQGKASCPVFGNIFKVHLSCYVNIV